VQERRLLKTGAADFTAVFTEKQTLKS